MRSRGAGGAAGAALGGGDMLNSAEGAPEQVLGDPRETRVHSVCGEPLADLSDGFGKATI